MKGKIKNNNFSCWIICSIFLFFHLLFQPSFAQFADNFSDGDITSNPAWSGDVSQWTDTLGKLRSNDTVASSKFYLSTASSLAANAQWEWWDSLQFNTSSSNYIDVYLISDSANLKAASFNGYFVRIGNTTDEISLYKRSGATLTKLIDGLDGLLNTSNNVMRVKVTRNASNLWTLQRDSTGTGNNFITEGTVTDATFNAGNFFGIAIQQSTSSFFKKHWFDNFYAGAITSDTVPPTLLNLSVISDTQIDLKFSETISLSSAENESNYIANNGIGNPASALRDITDSSLVHLTFATSFGNGITNLLSISGLQDAAGNSIAFPGQNFTYFVAVSPVYKDVVINEFMAKVTPNPSSLPPKEFVELFNNSSKVFDLAGWKYSVGSTSKTLPTYILLPGSFLILCASSDTSLFSPYGNAIGLTSWPALVDGGTSLSLTDNNNSNVDGLIYTPSWPGFSGGKSMELVNPKNPCTNLNNWKASIDTSGGTPGKINSVHDTTPDTQSPSLNGVNIVSPTQVELTFSENMDSASIASGTYLTDNGLNVVSVTVATGDFSVVTLTLNPPIDTAVVYTIKVSNVSDCSGNLISANDSLQFVIGYQPSAGDIIINEIFADPTPLIGLPDAEFVEIFNMSSKFLDLSNCNFSGATFPSGTALPPNGYLILCSTGSGNLFSNFGNVAAMGGWSSTFLTNSGKDLILSYGSIIIDRAFYSMSWYKDNAKDEGGWSLERINPNHPCSGADNWKASLDVSGGTPGKINSVYNIAPDVKPPTVSSVVVTTPSQVMITFSEGMDSASLVTNYTVNNGIVVSNALPLGPEFTSVLLDISPSLDSSTVYTGNIFYVSDCSGNSISNTTFSFAIGVTAGLNDVLINEIYPDPNSAVSSLPEVEFVELYNNSSKAINLEGCTFSDGSATAIITNAVIFPDGYLILCPATGSSDYLPYGRTIGLSNYPDLNNAGDNLTLKDASGNYIHQVNYSDTWYGDDAKKDGGWTLELIDPANPCGEGNNWRASNDAQGGTPGKVNSVKGANPDILPPKILSAFAINPLSIILFFDETLDSLSAKFGTYSINFGITVFAVLVIDKKTVQVNLATALQTNILYSVTASGMSDCVGNITSGAAVEFALTQQGEAGDLIINEVLFNPRTNGSDFVELYNNSGKIINLQDWVLANIDHDSVSNKKIISTVPMALFPGDFIVLTKDTANIRKEYPLGKPENYLQMYTTPSYNIDSGTVVLINNQNVLSDAFSYNDNMHFALLKDNKGVSLERIDYKRISGDATNWHSAAEAVGWATPGYKNSQYNPSEGDGSTVSVEPEIFSPDNDGSNDVVNINYKFSSPGFVANVEVYDSKGRPVRSLAKNILLGIEGTFSWDGISDYREKARIGIYLIWFEAFDLNGKVLHFKKTCVLAGKLN